MDAVSTMTVDEYETIGLIELEGFTREECAKQMNVARTTVQGIRRSEEKKLAHALVNRQGAVYRGRGIQSTMKGLETDVEGMSQEASMEGVYRETGKRPWVADHFYQWMLYPCF